EIARDGEFRLGTLDRRDILHPVQPEHAHRVALARAADAVPVTPGEHQPVRLDDALLLGVPADGVVAAAHGVALLHSPTQQREVLVRLGWRGLNERPLLVAYAQFRDVERHLAA